MILIDMLFSFVHTHCSCHEPFEAGILSYYIYYNF